MEGDHRDYDHVEIKLWKPDGTHDKIDTYGLNIAVIKAIRRLRDW